MDARIPNRPGSAVTPPATTASGRGLSMHTTSPRRATGRGSMHGQVSEQVQGITRPSHRIASRAAHHLMLNHPYLTNSHCRGRASRCLPVTQLDFSGTAISSPELTGT